MSSSKVSLGIEKSLLSDSEEMGGGRVDILKEGLIRFGDWFFIKNKGEREI